MTGPVYLKREAPWSLLGAIYEAVSDIFEVPVEDLKGRSRRHHIAHARFVVYYLAYTYGHWTYPQMAYKCRVDHTSILHGVNQVVCFMQQDRGYADLVRRAKTLAGLPLMKAAA